MLADVHHEDSASRRGMNRHNNGSFDFQSGIPV